jgi:hypothetical protein
MNQKEKDILLDFAKKVKELKININCTFSTKDYDYEIVTFIDEIQILDMDENVIISVLR